MWAESRVQRVGRVYSMVREEKRHRRGNYLTAKGEESFKDNRVFSPHEVS